MRTRILPVLLIALILCATAWCNDTIKLTSPGLAVSQVDSTGKLLEDWGTVDVGLSGQGISTAKTVTSSIRMNDVIPAAQVDSDHGLVKMSRTIYRAPIFPAGIDVMQVCLTAAKDKPVKGVLSLDLSAKTQLYRQVVRVGGRNVLKLPSVIVDNRPLLDWGYCDDASSIPGWAKPQGDCDPAFKNIRAGMGGVPIVYHFAVKPRSESEVILGFCESHWATAGQRPLTCRVEGADPKTIDPVGKWGQHKPGGVLFKARDVDADGKLIIRVRSATSAQDINPILNAIWVFPAGQGIAVDEVIAGAVGDTALYYVDVGGQKDQSVFPPAKMEFPFQIAAGDSQKFTFQIACPGGSVPAPDRSTWNPTTLLKAAHDVWRDAKP